MFRTHVSFLTVAFWQVFSGSQVLSGGLRWIVFKMAHSVSLCICFEYTFTIVSDQRLNKVIFEYVFTIVLD